MSTESVNRPRLRSRGRIATVLAILAIVLSTGAAASAQPPQIQVLPSPLRFVSSLDLECFRTDPHPPPVNALVTRHLNPALAGLPAETNPLGFREQLCVPVAKNHVIPPPEVLDFIRFVDLACYRTQGLNVNKLLTLRHLNPVLSGLPPKNVVISVPQQLCLPVVKNGLFPPAEVLRLISYIDLKCYLEMPQVALDKILNLAQLNPVLAHIPPTDVRVTLNRQLCVPVQKNNQPLPADIINIVRWIDLEKYDITPAAPAPIITLTLTHVNPLLANVPPEPATISGPLQLMLPVAKNNMIPPA
jgi:hypothetical protein